MKTLKNEIKIGGVGLHSGEESTLWMRPCGSAGIYFRNKSGLSAVTEAVVEEDGVAYTLRPGDCEYCTDGHSHAIYNRSDAPMSFLAIIIL